MPSEALAIEKETEEIAKKEDSIEDILANLPPGISIDESELDRSGPSVLAVFSLIFFLLCTVGLGSLTYFYLAPKLVEAEQDLTDAESAKKTVDTQITKESARGQEHEKKLKSIIDTAISPTKKLEFEFYIDELNNLATTVATKNESQGGYVTINSISISLDRSIAFGGEVNNLYTLADWLEAVEGSEYFSGANMTTFSPGDENQAKGIQYNLKMIIEPTPIEKDKALDEDQEALDTDTKDDSEDTKPVVTKPEAANSGIPSSATDTDKEPTTIPDSSNSTTPTN